MEDEWQKRWEAITGVVRAPNTVDHGWELARAMFMALAILVGDPFTAAVRAELADRNANWNEDGDGMTAAEFDRLLALPPRIG